MIADKKKAEKIIKKMFEQKIEDNNLFLFSGDLGTGKTTLISSIITELTGERYVNSPTYTIVNTYNWEDREIFHVDLYRLETIEDILELGIFEDVEQESIFFVEWPDDFMGFFKQWKHVMINLDKTDKEDEREIMIDEYSLY
ncbi:MAG: tRNA (adenosine(37)-N6)-threonylcarbamoyltransferase complex ATPase subunit type 1 TsaE [Candidatus Muiribacterium halophilum]|uniref:tRNA threonylcarbamoyladenosine biosynthesis protein TsaE n=1 Tax=Muiribacterium halophilum TaxID=2053465 RepID=A0A2N5ZMB6_MUIH1|nr:MAG: tRNA (adenosine(37)-N6)-threonylcarbamoyltransferase complex ATPase subunit type 1 TsaE [Candidatus Muirbacterium halophilum]